ncbi:MAG: hypothetical protein KMY54_01625 [Erysipelothrix sp.]|nr:hypothetical protein [Erysipelothrix sp.]
MNIYIITMIVGFIIIGFVKRLLLINKTKVDIYEINEYLSKFNKFVTNIYSKNSFDNNEYNWLVFKSDKVQNMLGGLGIIDYEYMGIYYKNMAILLNYLGDIPSVKNSMFSNSQHLIFQSQACQNAFIRYNGIFNGLLEDHKKMLLNPFACLSMGIRVIISLPFNILNSIGLISNDSVVRISNGFVINKLGSILSLIAILAGIITIVVEWETFIEKIKMLF